MGWYLFGGVIILVSLIGLLYVSKKKTKTKADKAMGNFCWITIASILVYGASYHIGRFVGQMMYNGGV